MELNITATADCINLISHGKSGGGESSRCLPCSPAQISLLGELHKKFL